MSEHASMTWTQLLEYVESLKDREPSDRLNSLRQVHEGLTQQPNKGNWVQCRARVRDIINERIGVEGDSPAAWDPVFGRRNSQEHNGDPNGRDNEAPPVPPTPETLPDSKEDKMPENGATGKGQEGVHVDPDPKKDLPRKGRGSYANDPQLAIVAVRRDHAEGVISDDEADDLIAGLNSESQKIRASNVGVVLPPPTPTGNGGGRVNGNHHQNNENGNGRNRAFYAVTGILGLLALGVIVVFVYLVLTRDDDDPGGSSSSSSSSSSTSGGGQGTPVAPATTQLPSNPTATAITTVPSGNPEATVSLAQTSTTGSMPELPTSASHGDWTINLNTDIGKDPVVRDWLARLRDPAPQVWRTYPNIPNPDVPEFDVKVGAEYGVANVPFCQQDMRCDLVVPGWHYRLITGDYEFLSHKCGGESQGCMLLLINVMDKTYTWRNQIVDNGFTVPGRYWDGELEWAVWGLVSHASANMLNMPTMASAEKVLNAGDPGNAGANCGDVRGCDKVDVFVVVHAGNRILATAHTIVTRP